MTLFFMNCERIVLFSVKHDLDPPFTTLYVAAIFLRVKLLIIILVDTCMYSDHEKSLHLQVKDRGVRLTKVKMQIL